MNFALYKKKLFELCVIVSFTDLRGSGSGKPPGTGEKKTFKVPREGRERQILLAGTRGSEFDFAGISAGKDCEVVSLAFLTYKSIRRGLC